MSEIEKYYNGEIHVDFEEEDLIWEIIEQHNEIERLKSIIKEVRQYIEERTCELNSCFSDGDWHCTTVKKLLEILDKEGNSNE